MSVPHLRPSRSPQSRSPQSRPALSVQVLSYRNRQALAHRRAHNRTKNSNDMAIEVSAMMAVNVFVAAIALVTIVKLIPHNATQQEQLQSLEAEVTALDNRVDVLRKEFVQYFDPQQAQVNKRQLSDRLTAGQRKIILTAPTTNEEGLNLDSELSENDGEVTKLE